MMEQEEKNGKDKLEHADLLDPGDCIEHVLLFEMLPSSVREESQVGHLVMLVVMLIDYDAGVNLDDVGVNDND